MNFNEALQVMGLDANLTEEELRKKYLKLAKAYHPDALIGKSEAEIKSAEEKMKNINLAYETLKKDKRSIQSDRQSGYTSNQTTNNYNGVFISYYRNSKIDILDNYKYSHINNKQEFSDDVAFDFNSFFDKYYFDIMSAGTKEAIDTLFRKFKKGVKDWYSQLKDIYFKEHNISEDIDFVVNEDLSFDEFYDNLEKAKEVNNIIKEIDAIVDKYKSYAYYSDLETEIEDLKNQTTKTFILALTKTNLDSYLNNKDYYLSKLKSDIERLFKRVAKNKPLYLEMARKVEEQYLSKKENLEVLRQSILSELFPLHYEQLKYELHCLDCFDEKVEIQENIVAKYNDALAKSSDFAYKDSITELYDKIEFLLLSINYIPIERVRLLNEIDFSNYDEAIKIYDKARRNLISSKDIEVAIGKDNLNGICVKYVQIDDVGYTISTNNNEDFINESNHTLENTITLDEFMEQAEEFFVTFSWNDEEIVGLYRLDSFVLGIYNGRLEFFKDIKVCNIEFQYRNDFASYQNKEFVKSIIINEYFREIELHKKQNNTMQK